MYKLYITVIFSYFLSSTVMAEIDPTKPFIGSSQHENNDADIKITLRLDSIIHGKNVHTAVINGKVVKVNDKVGDYRLIAVKDNSVVLSSEDERKELKLFSKLTIK